ncbi:LPS assembly lipoprotein LptE [Bosea sp. BK604]|uniref:LPS assembly lipoprotein LptE n=1 Tax=Bosea sp. BK604 TaxID=2512180 RepID=UPI00104E3E3F|nr:LPS assembly lipoprotein LptE [Bosea sp. BK604]TCR68949.1 LPS-assembly lipoprotein [Bosea sp. BK604]
MSSSESSAPTRRLMLLGALGAAAMAGGCLRPLYADSTTSTVGGSVKDALKGVEVADIKGLVGHYLRNELVFNLDGGGEPDRTKRLKLAASVTEALEVVTVDYANGRADSATLIATANWTVTDSVTGKVVSSGTNQIRAPYERSEQRFATVRAARDAQIRAGKSLAELIRGQLAADLTG